MLLRKYNLILPVITQIFTVNLQTINASHSNLTYIPQPNVLWTCCLCERAFPLVCFQYGRRSFVCTVEPPHGPVLALLPAVPCCLWRLRAASGCCVLLTAAACCLRRPRVIPGGRPLLVDEEMLTFDSLCVRVTYVPLLSTGPLCLLHHSSLLNRQL